MISSNKPSSIKNLFSSIALHYDKLNSWMSLGYHKSWNRALVESLVKRSKTNHMLDLCAGTGEISGIFLEKKKRKATLIDFCKPMLDIAKKRFGRQAKYIEADVMDLPLKDKSFTAASISYGLRNVRYPKKCIEEAHRVLKKGGILGILELTRPSNTLVRALHKLWLKIALPLMGKNLAENQEAYQYLAQSIEEFMEIEKIRSLLKEAGFGYIKIEPMTFGAATLITAKKL